MDATEMERKQESDDTIDRYMQTLISNAKRLVERLERIKKHKNRDRSEKISEMQSEIIQFPADCSSTLTSANKELQNRFI